MSHNILQLLAYFDIFNYPLTREDLSSFMNQEYDPCRMDSTLSVLAGEKIIFKLGEFYSLQNEPVLAERRRTGNKRAARQISIARKVAKILSFFPFVESIAVSGSLSKNYSDRNADIDFFMITSADRLWIARTCMHLLKKVSYLAGRQHWFCMNYFVDEKGMEIAEKNIFTAMEIVTLLPVEGLGSFQRFMKANSWTNDYFPEQKKIGNADVKIKKPMLTKWVENLLNWGPAQLLESRLMNITDRRWKKKTLQGKLNDHGDKAAMVAGPHFSKPDPTGFQEKIVQKYEEKIKKLLMSQVPDEVFYSDFF